MAKQKREKISSDVMPTHAFCKSQRTLLVLAVVFLLVVSTLPLEVSAEDQTESSISYSFSVDQDGFVMATVGFLSSEAQGSSWILVPNSGNWTRRLLHGSLLQSELVNASEVADLDNPFYEAFRFAFKSSGSFEMTIQFNMTIGAIIIEPRGMFFSPLMGFQEVNSGKAEVFLPTNSRLVEATALGNNIRYGPTTTTQDYALFDLRENILRLQIEFETATSQPELIELKRGIFSFETPKRYESYASGILDLFNITYSRYTGLFNVTLESVKLRFFIPEFDTILSVGGFVPFSGGSVGDIHINLFFARSVRGVPEIIALHELVHHFILKAGLSPNDLLWFHEGLAQYVSIETADMLGYTGGAASERNRIEDSASLLLQQTGGDLHFIQDWKPDGQPSNIGDYYAASYYVVSKLAENNSGLTFYETFFNVLKGTEIQNNDLLAYHLSLANGASVVPALRSWGFRVADLYEAPVQVVEAEKIIRELSPVLQPYKLIAEYLYRQALVSLERGDLEGANRYIETSIFIARNAAFLTLATLAIILITVVYVLKRSKPSYPAENRMQF